MSTFTEILNRPIKVQDVKSMGFTLEGDDLDTIAVIVLDGVEYELHLSEIVDGGFYGFTRYAGNTPAHNYMLGGLTKAGYKNVKIEGERTKLSDYPYYLNFYLSNKK